MKKLLILILLILVQPSYANDLALASIKLPLGFHISIYAQAVPYARQLALAPDGTVFVGTRKNIVYALLHQSNNFDHASEVLTIAQNLNAPNGVAFYNGAIYVAETNKVLKFPNILHTLPKIPKSIIINSQLPEESWHGYRYIKFGSDGWLYMAIGMPCNICQMSNPIFGTIIRMHANGSDMQIYATGIRNSMGFAWDPISKQLWFTDNGRDWLGDNSPPDELNYAPQANMNFGFPYVYGNNIPDPNFENKIPINDNFIPPAWNLPAHVAPLGMIFYTGHMFPKKYWNQIFIAEHGSWNRTQKIGYQIILVKVNNSKAISATPFATGWLQGQKFWGRPVDLLVLPDGSLLISDDEAGVIYRISYH